MSKISDISSISPIIRKTFPEHKFTIFELEISVLIAHLSGLDHHLTSLSGLMQLLNIYERCWWIIRKGIHWMPLIPNKDYRSKISKKYFGSLLRHLDRKYSLFPNVNPVAWKNPFKSDIDKIAANQFLTLLLLVLR